jgi:hypothetical protein
VSQMVRGSGTKSAAACHGDSCSTGGYTATRFRCPPELILRVVALRALRSGPLLFKTASDQLRAIRANVGADLIEEKEGSPGGSPSFCKNSGPPEQKEEGLEAVEEPFSVPYTQRFGRRRMTNLRALGRGSNAAAVALMKKAPLGAARMGALLCLAKMESDRLAVARWMLALAWPVQRKGPRPLR